VSRWISAGIPLAIFLLIAWFLMQGLNRNPREIPSPLIDRAAPLAALERLQDLEHHLASAARGNATASLLKPGPGQADPPALPSARKGNGASSASLPSPAVLYAGKVWMLNVWGSWCSGCQVEHPLLNALAAERLLPIVGLAWKDSPAQARQWLDRLGNPYSLVLMDLDGKAAIDWGVYGAPETFVIDARGMVRFKHVGPLSDEVVRGQLRPLLARLGAS
jgi:cytochrome c biogenesis protein CcmG/thiol:disulfide interchange protein DsbE